MKTLGNANANKAITSAIIRIFKEPSKLTEHISHAFTRYENPPPCWKWSLCNRLLVLLADTQDARSYNDWKKAGRKVTGGKGCAFFIWQPIIVKDKEIKDKTHLLGFKAGARFRVEDTQGDDVLEMKLLNTSPLEQLPLIELTKKMGVTVKFDETANQGAAAYFRPSASEIVMGTTSEKTFLHELIHAVDAKIDGKSKNYSFNECVAELGASTLCAMLGIEYGTREVYHYIERYASKEKKTVIQFCLSATRRIDSIIKYIVAES